MHSHLNDVINVDWFAQLVLPIVSLVDAGGPVIYAIFVVASLLWLLLLERYWFIYREHPRNLRHCLARWDECSDDWYGRKIRDEFQSILSIALNQHIITIKMLIALCPLLGLLGTVMGMIDVFDVLALTGTGNARAMADSISRATIPTMAGMVVALSGLYFCANLGRRVKNESFRLREDFQRDNLA